MNGGSDDGNTKSSHEVLERERKRRVNLIRWHLVINFLAQHEIKVDGQSALLTSPLFDLTIKEGRRVRRQAEEYLSNFPVTRKSLSVKFQDESLFTVMEIGVILEMEHRRLHPESCSEDVIKLARTVLRIFQQN
ncbi:MAG: hypothetical protein KW793_03805 [Candidatus Doudnabacteria bacterium]|nr:hypothetical protein [Candidatus Doudnabacteria bacterium]